MYPFCTRPPYRSVLRFLAVFAACVTLPLGAVVATAAESPEDSRSRFVQLDSEIQAIKEEILEINREILALEELALQGRGQELIVLVSMASDSPVTPDSISLQLDGRTLSRHRYSDRETDALREGGVHRLFVGRVQQGQHRLEVTVKSRQAGERDVRQEHSLAINRAGGRRYIEVQLGPVEQRRQPGLTIRSW